MGNSGTAGSTFEKSQWDIIERSPSCTIYRSRVDPQLHIQQHDIYSRDAEEHRYQSRSFQFRYRKPQLVSSVFYSSDQDHQFCSSSRTDKLFLEKIPIRLSDIEHVPHPDSLHLYYQSLVGFSQIVQEYGSFEVQEEHIGVNEKAVVKVWLNRDFSRSEVIGGRISEAQMVKGLVDILDKNCDPNLPNIPSVRNYLYRNADTLSFGQAIREFEEYLRQYNQGRIPSKLECVERVGGCKVIAARLSTQNDTLNSDRSAFPPQNQTGFPIYQNYNQPIEIKNYQQPIENPYFERPGVTSNTNLPFSEQFIGSHNVYSQFNLKASEALPNSSREEIIIDPQAYRRDVQVVRRSKNIDIPLKSSQNVFPVEIRSPIKSSQIIQINNVVTPLPQRPLFQQWEGVVRPEQERQLHQGVPYNQITFKALNQHQVSGKQLGNPSIGNFSLVPSQPSTHRARNSIQQTVVSSQTIQSEDHRLHSFEDVKLSQQLQPRQVQNLIMSPQQVQPLVNPQIIPQYHVVPQPSIITANSFSQIQTKPLKAQQLKTQLANPLLEFESPSRSAAPGFKPEKPSHFRPVEGQLFAGNFSNYPQVKSVLPSPEPLAKTVESPQKEYNINPSKINQISPQKKDSNLISQDQTSWKNSSKFEGQKLIVGKKSYHELNVDDGKSSPQFLKKLKEITQGGLSRDNHTETYANTSYQVSQPQQSYTFQKKILTQNFEPKYSYQPTIQPTAISADDEDFGRVAVSNIIETHEPASNSNKYWQYNNEPLKFENNLTMKYSVMEGEEESSNNIFQKNFEKSRFGGNYETQIDEDLIQDLRKIQQ